MDEREIKKKIILEQIPRGTYVGLMKFVERIYLEEYDLKIIMARKCSNLYAALLELVIEADGGRVGFLYQEKFKNGNKPVIVTDRALELLKKEIMKGKFKRILLVDDIIIHGRTLNKMCSRLVEWFDDNNITLIETLPNKKGGRNFFCV